MARSAALAVLLPTLATACPCCPTCNVCPCASTPEPEEEGPNPLMKCNVNCYGDAAVPVPLPGGDGNGVAAETIETCRDFCYATDGCEGVVFGQGMCYGKKDIRTSKCQTGGSFYTEMLTKMPYGTCVVMGDPHVLSFDNPVGQFGDITQTTHGDYYLIKSRSLHVQGRFGYSRRFPSEASLMGVAISGPLIQDNKLIISYAGGSGFSGYKVTWNGQQILTGLPSEFASTDKLLKAKLDNIDPDEIHQQARHTIGGTVGSGALPSFVFEIAPDITLYCLVGETAMNAVITLRMLQDGMDGYCGNFNCDGTDDSLEHVTNRGLGSPVNDDENLFKDAPPLPAEMTTKQGETPTLNDCKPELLSKAQEACKSKEIGMQDACIYDVCASGSVSAGQSDVMAVDLASEVGAKYSFLGLPLPGFLRGDLPVAAQLAGGLFVAGMVVAGVVSGYISRPRALRDNVLSRLGNRFGGSSMYSVSDEEEARLLEPPACEYEPVCTSERQE